MGRAVAYAAPAAAVSEDGQCREAGRAQQQQSVREPQFPLFRSGRRAQPARAGADPAGAAGDSGTQTAARDDGQGQRLSACRARQTRVARAGTLQPRDGRTHRGAGSGGPLSRCVRPDACRFGAARPSGGGRDACHALGLLDEHADAGHARTLFRRWHSRGPRRHVFGRTGRGGDGAFLQHLFVVHATGL